MDKKRSEKVLYKRGPQSNDISSYNFLKYFNILVDFQHTLEY